MRTDPELERPTTEALIAAMGAPGPLREQPAVRQLLASRRAGMTTDRPRPSLTLIEGGRDG
jgi:hypothetical protein